MVKCNTIYVFNDELFHSVESYYTNCHIIVKTDFISTKLSHNFVNYGMKAGNMCHTDKTNNRISEVNSKVPMNSL